MKLITKIALFFFALYLSILSFIQNRKGVHIIMYHRIRDDLTPNSMVVPVEIFRKHMEYYKRFCDVIDINQLLEMYADPQKMTPCRKPRVVITFDDGFRDNYLNAFPILKELKLPATIFLATGFIGTNKKMPRYVDLPSPDMLSWEEVVLMQQHNVTFCSHTVSHPRLLTLNYTEQKTEIKGGIDDLYSRLPADIVKFVFCYTYGQYNEDTLRVMRDLNIRVALTVKSGINTPNDDPLQLKRFCADGSRPLNKVMRQVNPSKLWT